VVHLSIKIVPYPYSDMHCILNYNIFILRSVYLYCLFVVVVGFAVPPRVIYQCCWVQFAILKCYHLTPLNVLFIVILYVRNNKIHYSGRGGPCVWYIFFNDFHSAVLKHSFLCSLCCRYITHLHYYYIYFVVILIL